ncbi:hypothetical protein [Ruegeria hyattellae]|uniref:hypothetical protein n=1 Tax=Ruegeria hyattellae TaxID=3233337 RepID=UPI00355B0EE3
MKTPLFFVTLFSASFAMMTFASADDPNPVDWVDRCMKSSKNQLDWVNERERCLDVILSYCEFSQENQTCFLRLATGFEDRADRIIVDFPDTIDADGVQKGFYDLRLSILSELTPEIQCQNEGSRVYCTALTAIQRYLAAQTLTDWLAEQRGKS